MCFGLMLLDYRNGDGRGVKDLKSSNPRTSKWISWAILYLTKAIPINSEILDSQFWLFNY